MKLKIIMMVLVLGGMMAVPYIMSKRQQGESILPSMNTIQRDVLSTEETRQQFVKWQDENGRWHFGEKAPAGVKTQTVNVDTAANIIQSIKVNKPDDENGGSKAQISAPSAPSLPVPMTITPDKVSKLIEDSQNVENLMNDRLKQIDNLSQ